jgi:hypothetical protein
MGAIEQKSHVEPILLFSTSSVSPQLQKNNLPRP